MSEQTLSEQEKKLLSLIGEKEMTDFLQQLVRCNSENPPGNEKTLALMIRDKLEDIGMETRLQEVEPDRYNVIGILPGRSPETLLFNGHMDTVKIGTLDQWTVDPLGGEIRDGRLYGRGSCDMKGGLTSMIYGIKALADSGIEREKTVMFTGVIDEEVFFKGTQKLIDTDVISRCTRCYISEPTSCGLAASLQGAAEFTAVIYGKSAHCGMAETGVNAIVPMADFVTELRKKETGLKEDFTGKGSPIWPTINVGLINGGTDVLLVPDRCEISFDRQVFPEEDMTRAIDEIEKLFDDICERHGVNGELRCNQYFMPWCVDREHPAVRAVKECHEKVCGAGPEEIIFRGYAEIEMLDRYGIPGALYGPGNILQAHRPDEFVEIREVTQAAGTYALIAYDFVKAK